MVAMDHRALGTGAGEFTQHASALEGHATTVAGLESLRDALQGSGIPVWTAVQARLVELQDQLKAAQERAAQAGTVLRAAADGSATIDQNNGNNLRM
jgi:hypothetical protein